MRKNIFIIIGTVCLMLSGFFSFLVIPRDLDTGPYLDFIEKFKNEASMNWATKALRVKGNGFGPEIAELGRRKILAKRAALLDAYRNLIEVVKGIQVTSCSSVEDMMVQSDWIKAKAGGMVKGMKVQEVIYANDGGCEVTVEVDIDKDGRFLLTALNTGEVMMIDIYPKVDWVALQKKTKDIQRKYNSLLAAFRRKGKELTQANQQLARMEERLKAADNTESQLKAQLVSAEKELEKTKHIVNELNSRLIILEIKLTKNEKELEMTRTFLSEKKKELDKLSDEIAKYSDAALVAMLDRERLLGYIHRIKEIQRETGKRLERFSPPEPHEPKKRGHSNEPDYADQKNYTGLLVDARGLNLKPALAPTILNEREEEMYGIGIIPAEVSGGAIVDYLAGSIERAKKYKKIAHHPLVVKGIKVVNKSDIMISNKDAQRMGHIFELLRAGKVAILHDGQ